LTHNLSHRPDTVLVCPLCPVHVPSCNHTPMNAMKAPSKLRLFPSVLALLVACNNPPTGELPAELVVVQAPPSAGAPGWVLVDTLKVRLVDPAGNPRPGALVTWVVTKGQGSVAEMSATTDAEGISAALWTLGDRSGLNELRVSTHDDAFVTFQAVGEAFRVDRLASATIEMGCGLVAGALWCWGEDFWAPTPPPSHHDVLVNQSPGLVDDTHDFVDVAVGFLSVCGLDVQLEVWCATRDAPQVAPVNGLPPSRRVVADRSGNPPQYCALAVSDSTAWCWRGNAAAVQVPGSPAFTDMWMDFTYACGLRADSTAACWGDGPLGDGSTGSSDTPVSVSGGHRFVELAVGLRFACGRTAAGAVWCWGKHDPRRGAGIVPSDILNPALATTGAFRIGAGLWWAQMMSAGPMVRWVGAGYTAASRPTGLSQLPVVGFASNDLSCVQLVDGQVYCLGEMFDLSSVPREDNYVSVQPVRRFP